MKKLLHVLTTSLLISVFGIFSAGVPIVHYLCPLMNDDVMTCPMSQHTGTQGATLTDVTPSCCASYIVAERNTTPYTSIDKFAAQPIQIQAFLVPDFCFTGNPLSVSVLSSGTTSSPPPADEPLYILNSSILI